MPRRHDQHTSLEAGFAGPYEVLKPSQDAGIAHPGQRLKGGLDDRGVLLMLEQGFQRGFRAPVPDSIQGEHGTSSDARSIVVQQSHQDIETERRRHRAQGFHGLFRDVRGRIAHALEEWIHGLRRADPAQRLYSLPAHVAVAVLQQRDQFVHGQVAARFTQFTGGPGPDRGIARFTHAHEVPQGRDGVPLAHAVDHVPGRYLRIGGHAGQQAHVGDAQRPVGKEEVLQSRKSVAEEGDGGNGRTQIGGNAAQYGATRRTPSRYRGVATEERGAVDRRGRLDDEIEPGGTPTRAHAAPPDLHQRHHDPVVFQGHEPPSQWKHGQSHGGKRHDGLVSVLVRQITPEGIHDDRGDGLYSRVDRDLGVGDLQRPQHVDREERRGDLGDEEPSRYQEHQSAKGSVPEGQAKQLVRRDVFSLALLRFGNAGPGQDPEAGENHGRDEQCSEAFLLVSHGVRTQEESRADRRDQSGGRRQTALPGDEAAAHLVGNQVGQPGLARRGNQGHGGLRQGDAAHERKHLVYLEEEKGDEGDGQPERRTDGIGGQAQRLAPLQTLDQQWGEGLKQLADGNGRGNKTDHGAGCTEMQRVTRGVDARSNRRMH